MSSFFRMGRQPDTFALVVGFEGYVAASDGASRQRSATAAARAEEAAAWRAKQQATRAEADARAVADSLARLRTPVRDEPKTPKIKTEHEASSLVAERRRALRAASRRVQDRDWDQIERGASSTRLRVAQDEAAQLLRRVAEEEAAQLKAEEDALIAAADESRALQAEGERILESERAEPERGASSTAASVVSLKRLRVAEAEAPRLEAGPEASVPAAERRAFLRRHALRAGSDRILESKWADQTERDTARTAANLKRLRVAENRAARLEAGRASLPAAERRRALRAESQRVLDSKWAEPAEGP